MEDSQQNTTNNLNVTEDSTTTSSPGAPSAETAEPAILEGTESEAAVNWDQTLTWDNSLAQLKLLKSVGNGSQYSCIVGWSLLTLQGSRLNLPPD